MEVKVAAWRISSLPSKSAHAEGDNDGAPARRWWHTSEGHRVPEPSSSMHRRCRNGTESSCAEELGTISRRTESGRADRCGSLRADRRLRLRLGRSTGVGEIGCA